MGHLRGRLAFALIALLALLTAQSALPLGGVRDIGAVEVGCGDGIINTDQGEVCDDGNLFDGDGCSSACVIEAGFDCIGEPSVCVAEVEQSKEKQECINALNKGFAKVAKAKGKVVCACIKKGAKDRLTDATIEDCLSTDPKRKVQKAVDKLDSDFSKYCVETPDFGPTNGLLVASPAIQKELDLVHDVFGSDLDATIEPEAFDKATSKCQQAVMKEVKKCQGAKIKVFNRCKKNGIKEVIENFVDLQEDCMGVGAFGIPDGKLKIAKACDPTSGKIRSTIDKKCSGPVNVSTAFPACGTSDPTTLAACLDEKIECRVCLALNEADNLARDCDEFDDGVVNGSCP